MDPPIVAVVLAGGTGTRLYPASRADRPKQFLAFGGERSLLQRTVERVSFVDETFVLAPERLACAVRDHLPGVDLLVEPAPRDTGPALVYAAHALRDRDAVLLCLPSDHYVSGKFEPAVRQATRIADETHGLVLLGVEPTRPETGYGYLLPGREHDGYAPVEQFHEKPDPARAARLAEEGWLWNTGMFAWTPGALLSEARNSSLAELVEALDDGEPERGFDAVTAESIDRAVLERTARAFVVPAAFEWDDLGSWDAVGRLVGGPLCLSLEIDASGNVLAGDHHVTAIGVSDLVVAAYGDRVLVVQRSQAQRVREAVEMLREQGSL